MKTNTHQPSRTRKLITYGVIAAMIHAPLAPAIAATGAQHQYEQAQQAQQQSTDDAVSQMMELAAKHTLNIDVIKETESSRLANRSVMTKMVDGVKHVFMDSPEERAVHNQNNTAVDAVLALETQMHEEHAVLLQQLNQQIQQDKNNNMSDSVAEQQQLLDELNKRYQTLTGLINNLKTADGDTAKNNALAALNTQLTDWQPKKPSIDRNTLPWGTPKNEVRKPIVKDTPTINKVSYQQTGSTAIGQWRDTEYKIANQLLNNNPIKKVAAGGLSGMTAGNWTVLKALPAKVQPEDLTETDDIQINEEIKKLAKELDHSPAKIYKWVYDNIEFVPTYGSIQGSAFTLETKRGNATDTASLLIALLRAAKVPARYVYGTVDVPANFAKDWVGGVNNIDAAQNLLGQGGVPNTAVMSGSVPKYLRLEHVWVEANVDYIGSRGALSADKTTNNAKQWIPLDASYKSHTRTQGIDLAKAVPFDAEKLIEDAKQGATIDEDQGSVQNLNQDAINQALKDYQAKVKTYLEKNHADATVGDVLGTNTINAYKSDTLAPILPYQVKTVIKDYQKLPESMKHYFIVNMYQDASEYRNTYALGEAPNVYIKIPTTQLQGKPLAMSFKPATEADAKQISNSLPKPDSNGEINPNNIPNSFSSSLKMSAEITLNGETLSTGNTYGFGSEVITTLGYYSPNSTGSVQTSIGLAKKVIRAGEYHAIGYDMQGMSQKQLEQTKNTLETIKNKLENYQTNQNQAVLDGISKHDIAGSILQANVQSYFAINDVQDSIAASQAKNIINNRFMSFGTFHTFVKPNRRFGLTFGGRLTGMQMDIDRLMTTTVDKNNNSDNLKAHIRSQGTRESANEHLVPELMFDNPKTTEKEVEGVSAVKAMQIAASKGQKIFTITKANKNKILPLLNHDSGSMQDINQALNAGKEVITHQSRINHKSWTGSGYAIIDPDTGAGAYLISGGANGSSISDSSGVLSTFLLGVMMGFTIGLGGAVILMGGLPAIILGIALIITASVIITSIANDLLKQDKNEDYKCFILGFFIGLPLGATFGGSGITYTSLYFLILGILGTSFIEDKESNRIYSIGKCLEI